MRFEKEYEDYLNMQCNIYGIDRDYFRNSKIDHYKIFIENCLETANEKVRQLSELVKNFNPDTKTFSEI